MFYPYFDGWISIVDKAVSKIPPGRGEFRISISEADRREFLELTKTQDILWTSLLEVRPLLELEETVEQLLLQEGFAQRTPNGQLQFTDKGLEVKLHGTIGLYKKYIKDQLELQQKVLSSTIDTNDSVKSNNKITLLVAVLALLISGLSVYIAWLTYSNQGNEKELQEINKTLKMQLIILNRTPQRVPGNTTGHQTDSTQNGNTSSRHK